ncbi:MAG: thiamine-phosphate kinase [Candidatus Aminicenantes bacterium]|nr:MAG: thiamine-phosphate kinase [Candidatus Aminicenantes bacterium]
MPKTLADIGEFGLIHRIHELVKKEGVHAPEVTVGIGDDTASFRPREGYEQLVTCDCLVEGRHYLPDFITPEDLGRRAMVMNLSDIGAMGGHPLYALISLGLKADMPVADVEAIYRGFIMELNPFEASIIGGNITKTMDATFIDITLIGEVEQDKLLRRSTARVGDTILVTGYPGQAAAGLKLMLRSKPTKDLQKHPLVRSFNSPSHRVKEGQAVANSGLASAMIDTSDGFLGDLGHICQESGVGALLIQEQFPISENLREIALQLKLDPHELFLQESDDYELIITCSPENAAQIHTAIAAVSDAPVTEVGKITDAAGNFQLILPDGSQRRVKPAGWDHFVK